MFSGSIPFISHFFWINGYVFDGINFHFQELLATLADFEAPEGDLGFRVCFLGHEPHTLGGLEIIDGNIWKTPHGHPMLVKTNRFWGLSLAIH